MIDRITLALAEINMTVIAGMGSRHNSEGLTKPPLTVATVMLPTYIVAIKAHAASAFDPVLLSIAGIEKIRTVNIILTIEVTVYSVFT
jgi:hypothetical protein